jgi:hypothetical protein
MVLTHSTDNTNIINNSALFSNQIATSTTGTSTRIYFNKRPATMVFNARVFKSLTSPFLPVLLAFALGATSSPQYQCELFLAESTLPNSGLGMFSGVEKKPNDTIGDGDLAFLTLDFDSAWDLLLTVRRERTKRSRDVFKDYVWSGPHVGMALESVRWPHKVIGFGFYSAANSVNPLENVRLPFPLLHSSHGNDLTYMPHRSTDPGAGAVTTYRSGTSLVKRAIPEGGEVFVSYGDGYFFGRSSFYGENFPLSGSFREANALLKRYEASQFSPLSDALVEIRKIWKDSSRVLNALPGNDEDLSLALKDGIEIIYQKNSTRPLEWLQEHGTCVDHIAHKPSTIPGVGEGAFAKRRLPKGTVITGSPLWTLEDDSYLDLGNAFDDGENVDRSHMKQILYNYCFGHKESSLLFLPYGASGALYINHGSGKEANVGVRWSSPGKLRHNPSLFDQSADEIMDSYKGPQLGIEYVALIDIEEGHELFLDYGEKWEEAWDNHVKRWRPVKDNTIASDWNGMVNEPIRTKEEEVHNPYPASIIVRCHTDLLSKNSSTWAELEWSRHVFPSLYGHPCEVLERSTDNSTYKVSLTTNDGEKILDKVPRESIFFLDAPHKSDLFLENAFRFTIQLPDEMVPESWRNWKRMSTTEWGNGEL